MLIENRVLDSANQQQEGTQEAQDELMNLMTIMYITIQEVLGSDDDMMDVRGKLRMYSVTRSHSKTANHMAQLR
jgi:hypothetical protein